MHAVRSGAWALLVGLAIAMCSASGAGAQDRTSTLSESDRAQARALFAAGGAAIDAGRWADAVDSFRRAYELTGAPSALFNTAFALRALGRYREAAQAFGELLALEGISDSVRAQATELRDEVRGRLALVRLLGLEAEARYVVRLDGEGIDDTGTRPLVLQADPGRHTLDVSRPGFVRFEWAGSLEDGQMLDLGVELAREAERAGGEGGGGGGNVLEEPWLWIVIGALVIGGAVVGGWYADDQAQLRPESSMSVRL